MQVSGGSKRRSPSAARSSTKRKILACIVPPPVIPLNATDLADLDERAGEVRRGVAGREDAVLRVVLHEVRHGFHPVVRVLQGKG